MKHINLKNHKTKIYEFVQGLKKKFCLLLTATPIQNDVFELFYLISLLKPGHLGNYETFQSSFSASKHSVEHDEYLRELVNQVMVRNRREETGIEWTSRRVQTIPIEFTNEEREVYDLILELKNVSSVFSGAFSMITLQKEMCSSKEATYLTLTKMRQNCTKQEEIDFVDEYYSKINGIGNKFESGKSCMKLFPKQTIRSLSLQNIKLVKFIYNGI